MALPPLLALLVGPLLLTVIALAAHSRARGAVDAHHEWRWVRLTWGAALAVGGVTAWFVNARLDLGRGTMLVPAILGLFMVGGVGLAETVVRPRRPAGVRSASLAPRRVPDFLPRTLATAVGVMTAVHLATLALTTATASPDDMGRAGRQIAAQCGSTASGAGPYPGSFYSGPLTVVLVMTGLAAVVAMTAVVRRPRGFAADDVGEDVLRRRSVARVLAAAGAAVAASHAGIAFFAGTALLRMDCQAAWMDPVGWLLVATVPAALALLIWFLARVAVPAGRPAAARTRATELR
ncbi:hypothetical protein [Georgenia satyanarayanai]|uniref:hypothetical protein n=1 Tax=Georgenia satyanarayanai TaxID=860221 RepID=UPI0012649F22|nr:hypothetical protein [Georgenia satyanarayanai]